MMPSYPYNIYRENLTSLYHGHALWEPDPAQRYQQVSVGDVGYVKAGFFCRMFNVLLEWNDPSNRECEPEPYLRLDLGPFINIRKTSFSKGDYYSRYVTAIQGTTYSVAATSDNSPGTTYQCKRQGALLTLPHDGLREDVIRTVVFEDYIRDHVDSWFSFAQRRGLGVERIEDLILVTGCTLVTSWGAAAFLDSALGAEVSLKTQILNDGRASFDWSEIRPSVAFHNSQQDPGNLCRNQCVFIRGFRAKRRVFLWTRLTGAARPFLEDPDNDREDEIEMARVADVLNYRDPLIGVLDYIAEKCPDNTIAIAHDDDLQLIEDVDTLDADTVEGFLRQNETGVLVRNGAATLHKNEGPEIPDEARSTFYAEAELVGSSIPIILHPVLSNYLLKLDIANQPLDYDHHLPKEDMTSPAVHPPVSSLKLENHQGYPQHIIVRSSPGTGITVQDVLRTIHEDMRTPSRRRDWAGLNPKEQAAVDTAFSGRCRTQRELSQGPCRIDYLCGRNRLQILPKHSPHHDLLSAPLIPSQGPGKPVD